MRSFSKHNSIINRIIIGIFIIIIAWGLNVSHNDINNNNKDILKLQNTLKISDSIALTNKIVIINNQLLLIEKWDTLKSLMDKKNK